MPVRLLVLAVSIVLVAGLQPALFATADAPPAAAGVSAAYRPGRMTGDGVTSSRKAPQGGEKLTVQTLPVGRPAAEPTLGVDGAGNVFYAAGTFDGPLNPTLPGTEITVPNAVRTFVMRSSDRGLTWSNVSPMIPGADTSSPPVTVDPMVYVDEETGRVFNPELYAGCSYMNISDDQGATWIPNPVACGNFVNDHQTIVSGNPPALLEPAMVAYPNIVYYCFNRVIDSNCGRSLDGGLTFTPTPTPAFVGYDPAAGGLCGGLHGHIATDSEGRLFVPKGHCGSPWLAVTSDAGTTWTRVKVSETVSAAATHLAVAVDDADNVYFLWWDAENRLPWLAVSTDHGLTFGEPMMVAPPGVQEVNFPVLVAGAEGRVAITFPGSTAERPPSPPDHPLEPVGVTNPGDTKRPWNHYLVVTDNALADNPLFLSTTANDPADPVHRGDCGPGRCGALWDFEDIVVSPVDGRFWAAVADGCTAIMACNTPDGAAPGILEMPVGDGLVVRQLSGPVLRPAKHSAGGPGRR